MEGGLIGAPQPGVTISQAGEHEGHGFQGVLLCLELAVEAVPPLAPVLAVEGSVPIAVADELPDHPVDLFGLHREIALQDPAGLRLTPQGPGDTGVQDPRDARGIHGSDLQGAGQCQLPLDQIGLAAQILHGGAVGGQGINVVGSQARGSPRLQRGLAVAAQRRVRHAQNQARVEIIGRHLARRLQKTHHLRRRDSRRATAGGQGHPCPRVTRLRAAERLQGGHAPVGAAHAKEDRGLPVSAEPGVFVSGTNLLEEPPSKLGFGPQDQPQGPLG